MVLSGLNASYDRELLSVILVIFVCVKTQQVYDIVSGIEQVGQGNIIALVLEKGKL